MSKKKTNAELQAELNVLRRGHLGGNVASVVNNLIRWGGAVAIVYFLSQSVSVLAGHTTVANIGLHVIGNLRLSDAFAVIFGGGGVGYGLRQRGLRRETVERLQRRIRELEKHTDPGRSSSGLTPRGETNPKDA